MSKSCFTPEQLQLLRENPYTAYVSEKTIRFTPDFKNEFWDSYILGKCPKDIFRSLGYDPDVLGTGRISNFAHNLAKAKAENVKLTPADKTERLERQVEALQYQVDVIKKCLERDAEMRRNKF